MAKLSTYLTNIFLIVVLLQIAPPILHNIKKQYTEMLTPQSKVAHLTITGVVYNSTNYIKYFKKYFKDQSIKAILLSIESPGAAAGSAEAIANEITLLKKEYPKPIVTLCENICTSGSYYVAVTTDYIISPPSALIGSIGTKIPYQFKLKEFLEQYKIKYVPINAGAYKDATDPFSELTPEQKDMLEGVAQDSYENFIEHVSKNRKKIALNNANEWGNGKIFTARQAHKIGLIDEIGSQTNAIDQIKKLAILEEKIEWVKPERETGWLSSLFGSATETGGALSITIEAILKNFFNI
jgi:protease IV